MEPLGNRKAADIYGCGWNGDCFYYYAFGAISGKPADLYVMKNGEVEKILPNISAKSVKRYDDGSVLAYEADGEGDGDRLMCYNENGGKRLIGEGVLRYSYFSPDCILCMTNEGLYLYTGEDGREIAGNVQGYVCREPEAAYDSSR